ncbi:uncharacterized protein C8R40DRAFT_1158497 [Lentinula edodes]|uniref:uncharacterized protein n=1 Tax=Lentinula edodes TaxID=5353 RepID=UPI001E8E9FAA|nr:uncharacterized protein C8R40DRAFT_1158497 [Lentinula edodes]KAH7879896.1 hypothetical protein C8R40DRAFT_1158497 [Lentinula edodes]
MNSNSRSTSNLSLKSSRSRKHSLTLSNTMGWLSRHSTQSSVSSFYKGNKNGSSPASQSQHKPARSIELVNNARHGPLGSGATVVRTPEEALYDSGVDSRPSLQRSSTSQSFNSSRPTLQRSATSGSKPLESPPLPSLPPDLRNSDLSSEDEYYDEGDNDILSASAGLSWPTPPSAIAPLPPTPSLPSLRSSLKPKLRSNSDEFRVPALPAHVTQSSPQPPFEPVLISGVPSGVVDPSTVLVTVETSTTSHKTTFKTLTSRPSQLASYLHSLFPRPRRDSDASSVYSTASDDMSTYRNHLASQGLLPQAPVNIHIFLDRPSAPYVHILNYLRSPVGSADAPELLPRAAQLHPPNSQSRLEALLELRDEASYLDLDDLYKLCSDEVRQRQPALQPRLPRTHSRGQSSNSTNPGYGVDSQHTSLSSMHTLLDRSGQSPPHVRARELSTISDDRASIKASNEYCSDFQPRSQTTSKRSPPTPESWKDGRNSGSSTSTRGARRNDLLRSPPAGWI